MTHATKVSHLAVRWLVRVGTMEVPIEEVGLLIGSDVYNRVVLRPNREEVEPLFAMLQIRHGDPAIRCLGSTKIMVNGVALPRNSTEYTALEKGSVLRIGTVEMEIDAVEVEAPEVGWLIHQGDEGVALRADRNPTVIGGDSKRDHIILEGLSASALVLDTLSGTLTLRCAAKVGEVDYEAGQVISIREEDLVPIHIGEVEAFLEKIPEVRGPQRKWELLAVQLRTGGCGGDRAGVLTFVYKDLPLIQLTIPPQQAELAQLLLENRDRLLTNAEIERHVQCQSAVMCFFRFKSSLKNGGVPTADILDRRRGQATRIVLPPSCKVEIIR